MKSLVIHHPYLVLALWVVTVVVAVAVLTVTVVCFDDEPRPGRSWWPFRESTADWTDDDVDWLDSCGIDPDRTVTEVTQ